MDRPGWSLLALCTLLGASTADGACVVPSMYIDSTLSIAGCFKESPYGGLYQTTVWTIEGRDIADTGTTAIVADLRDGDLGDPSWTIGTVVSNPPNTWSDGLTAGLQVVKPVCAGTSAFWEMDDPTEEVQWKCDSNGDGVLTIGESDFTIACGCPGDAVAVTASPTTPSPSVASVAMPTVAPVVLASPPTLAPEKPPTLAPVKVAPIPSPEPTPAPIGTERGIPDAGVTPAPAVGGDLALEAAACNITLTSDALRDVAGCYVGTVSSNARGAWVLPDDSSSIVWKEPERADEAGYWAVVLSGTGVENLNKCVSSEDVDDPTAIPEALWMCDADGDLTFSAAERGDFEGLECNPGACETTTSLEDLGDSSGSNGGSGSTTAIIVGGAIGGVVVAGLLAVAVFAAKRNRRAKARGVASAAEGEKQDPDDPNAPPAPIPVFEPWGTRPPPKYYA